MERRDQRGKGSRLGALEPGRGEAAPRDSGSRRREVADGTTAAAKLAGGRRSGVEPGKGSALPAARPIRAVGPRAVGRSRGGAGQRYLQFPPVDSVRTTVVKPVHAHVGAVRLLDRWLCQRAGAGPPGGPFAHPARGGRHGSGLPQRIAGATRIFARLPARLSRRIRPRRAGR